MGATVGGDPTAGIKLGLDANGSVIIADLAHGDLGPDERDLKVMHETRIPKGFYEMDFVFSQRFSNEYYINKRDYTLISRKQYQTLSQQQRDNYDAHKLLHFRNVKGFENVLLHWGNTEKGTSGCYIVGTSIVMAAAKKKSAKKSKKKVDAAWIAAADPTPEQ